MERLSLEHERHERQERWDAITRDVDDIRDSLGKQVDLGVRETLIALRANGISTTQSCEGHEDHGHALPWVDIGAPEPDGWKQNKEIQRQWEEGNAEAVRKAQEMLVSWYERRKADGEAAGPEELHLAPKDVYGAARLEPKAQAWMSKRTAEERSHIPPKFRKEIDKFTAFLRERFFVE